MASPYTVAYWKSLERRWADEVMSLTLATIERPEERERYATLIGHDPATVEAVFQAARADGTTSFLGRVTPFDALLSHEYKQVQEAAEKFELSVQKRPFFGTLPTSRVNAQAILVERTGDLILAFEAGLYPAIWNVGDLLAATLRSDGEQSGLSFSPAPPEIRGEAIAWGAKLVANYLFGGSPLISQPLKSTEANKRIGKLFSGFMTRFVMGHEFTHLALGHFKGGRITRLSMAGSGECEAVEPRSADCEHEADQVGMVLDASSWLFGKHIPYWFSAPLSTFFLSFVATVYGAVEVITGVPIDDREHPSFSDRIDVLSDAQESLVGNDSLEHLRSWRSLLTEVAMELDDGAMTLVQRLFQEGYRLAPMWQNLSVVSAKNPSAAALNFVGRP